MISWPFNSTSLWIIEEGGVIRVERSQHCMISQIHERKPFRTSSKIAANQIELAFIVLRELQTKAILPLAAEWTSFTFTFRHIPPIICSLQWIISFQYKDRLSVSEIIQNSQAWLWHSGMLKFAFYVHLAVISSITVYHWVYWHQLQHWKEVYLGLDSADVCIPGLSVQKIEFVIFL